MVQQRGAISGCQIYANRRSSFITEAFPKANHIKKGTRLSQVPKARLENGWQRKLDEPSYITFIAALMLF
jgi:hypothetical protein